jgi:hypothetical protein
MKQFYRLQVVFFLFFVAQTRSSAQITGGEISFDNGSLTTAQKTCVRACISGSGVGCYQRANNYTYPTGGSGQYRYSWEYKTGNGSWVSMTSGPVSDSSYYHLLPQPQQINTTLYFRRKAKDAVNPNDSAYSNQISLGSYTYIHGTLDFISGSTQNTVPAGTSPLQIRNTGAFTDNFWDSYIFWEEKVGRNGRWLIVDYYQISASFNMTYYYQPPARNTHDTVYYRSYLENSCTDYDTTFSSIVTVIFANRINFNPGTISANTYNACSRTPIKISSTSTTAPSPYVSSIEISTDSANWSTKCNSCDSVVDNSFAQTTLYRRKVEAQQSIFYSNVIKVVAGGVVGDTAVFAIKKWNFYGYNGTNISNPTTNTYRGYYTRDSMDIDTRTSWADTASPSSAPGFVGCPININNFVLIAKRQGFDTGSYQIFIPNQKGALSIIKNGIVLFNLSCCNINGTRLDIGKLGNSTKLEIRFVAGLGATPLVIDFVKVGARLSSFVNADCNKYWIDRLKSSDFINVIDTTGAPVLAVNTRSQSFGYLNGWMKHSPPGAANIPVDSNGFHFMPRYYKFECSYGSQTFSTITIRLYFFNSELDDYRVATNKLNLTPNDLSVLHYKGANEDCHTNNNISYGSVIAPIATGSFGDDAFYVDVEVTSFSEFGVTADATNLPVSFINIQGKNSGENNVISWQIAEKLKDGRFEVLRSFNGISFSKIGNVESNGNLDLIRFSYTDRSVIAKDEHVFYKIKQIDRNGKFSFSSIVKVKMTGSSITAHPNPARNATVIKSSTPITQVSITDLRGRVIKTIKCNSTVVPVTLSLLSKGVYLLKAILIQGESKVISISKD